MEKKEQEASKPKRIVCKAGNVFCVEVKGLHKRYFQYLGRDRFQLGTDLIRVFKKCYHVNSEPTIDDIISDDVDFYKYTWVYYGVKEGYWYRVGTSKNLGNLDDVLFIYEPLGSGYSENWNLRKAFTQDVIFCGKLPVKYQTYEMSFIEYPEYVVQQINDGYAFQRGVARFLKCKSSEVKLEYTKKAGIDEMKGPGFILPKDNLKPIKFRESLLKPGIGVANEGLRGFEPKEAYMYCCKVTALLEEKKSSGLPTDDEMAVLRKFGDILDYVVKGPDLDRPDGLFAGYMISSGRMESVWMVSRPDFVAERLNAYISSERYLRNFESRIEEDPQWNTVNRMLDRIG